MAELIATPIPTPIQRIEDQSQQQPEFASLENIHKETEESELLGLKVNTVKEAFKIYNEYAFKKGFVVRYSRTRRSEANGEVKGQEFCCNKEGLKKENKEKKYSKLIRRTNCKAMIYFKIDNNGAWEVVRHRTEHNHSFCPPEQVHHVRSQRGITNEEVQYLVHMKRRGVGVAEAYRCLRVEATSSPALGFSLEDVYNAVARAMRKQFDGCDANTLINIFKQRQANEEDFYWDFEVDLDSSLTSFFWRDKKMKEDYMVFGDLVVHDTTYRTNKYDLICGPFVGMNSHGHNCMFGCGFILNERTCSFEWLFTTFLKSMEGLYPKTLMTDQSFAMNSAIQSVFVGVTHRLCIWHIGENSRAHIRDLRQKDGFMDVFDRVLKKCHTSLEFEYFWNKMTTDFKCNDNAWLNRLYELKYKWSRAYTKDVFSGGILSSQRSESTNNALSHRLHKSSSLYDFYNNFCEVIGEWRSKEGKDDELCWEGYPQIAVPFVKLLYNASRIYTINAYKLFETEFLRGMTHKHELRSEEDRILVYFVWIPGYDYFGNLVTYDISNNNVCCTCKRFEEFGILCRHVLRIYHVHCVEDIPSTYILNRWSRDAKPKPTNESEKPPERKEMVGSAVCRLHIQRKFHKLVVADDNNAECRRSIEELFNKAREEVESHIGSIYISDEEITDNDEDIIVNPKGKKQKYVSNDRPKSILEVKTNIARGKKKKAATSNEEAKKRKEKPPQVPINH